MGASKAAMIQKHAILQSKVDPPFQRYSFCYFFNSNFWVGKKLEEEETNWEWKAKLVISLLYSLPYCDFSWRSSINTADTLNDYFLLFLYSSCKGKQFSSRFYCYWSVTFYILSRVAPRCLKITAKSHLTLPAKRSLHFEWTEVNQKCQKG